MLLTNKSVACVTGPFGISVYRAFFSSLSLLVCVYIYKIFLCHLKIRLQVSDEMGSDHKAMLHHKYYSLKIVVFAVAYNFGSPRF